MNLKQELAKIRKGTNLSAREAEELFSLLLTDSSIPDSLIGAILMALQMKKETFLEVVGTVLAVRSVGGYPQRSIRPDLMDICGTGSDGASTVNISTATAFILAAAENCLPVAKHCGGSSSGTSGSLDVLRELGVRTAENLQEALEDLERYRVCFMSAPAFHPTLGRINRIRKEIGGSTIFNLALPLANPLGIAVQLVGVTGYKALEQVSRAAQELGGRHIIILIGHGGVDEITLEGKGEAYEFVFSVGGSSVVNKKHELWTSDLPSVGMRPSSRQHLCVENSFQSAMRIRAVLDGASGPVTDTILLNAGIGLYLGEVVDSWFDGVRYAQELLRSGAAKAVFQAMQK
ncbi:MAG: anthranilate phosphoribosyltransferase [Patescibacteria group bacterium]